MKTFKDLLIELDACKPEKDWAGDKTIEEVVAECHRGDWLEWLALEVGVDKRKRVLAGGLCANTVRHLMKDARSLIAVDVAIAYGKGEASEEELEAAAWDAWDAWEAARGIGGDWAADADAAWAAWTAAREARAAARAAAWAAAWDAADAGANQRQTADICREVMGEEIIKKVNQLLKS